MRRLLAWLRDTGAFLVAQPLALLIVLVAAVAGAAAGVPPGQKLYDYMWKDPVFCGVCHIHDYANVAWADSVHAQLTTCHDCHRVPIRHYPRNLYKSVFMRARTPEEVPPAHVGAVLCAQCHSEEGAHEPLSGPMPEAVRAFVARIDHSPLHQVHLEATSRDPRGEGAPTGPPPANGAVPDGAHGGTTGEDGHGHGPAAPIGCLDCHGGQDLEVHTFAARAADCESCHRGITPRDEHGAGLSCLDCHSRGFVGSTPDDIPPSP